MTKQVYFIDDIIEGNFKLLGKWNKGKIISTVNDTGTYAILYDDGEVEEGVNAEMIRHFAIPATDNIQSLVEGIKVEGNYRGRGKYYPGKISKVRDNGKYEITYEDGEVEDDINHDMIRLPNTPTHDLSYDDGSLPIAVNGSVQFQVDDIIEGNYRGRGTWYKGKISKIENIGIYEIKYDDGEVERGVSADLIRLFTIDFPSWNLDGISGPIVMNGIPIDAVLGKIREQILVLKDRSHEAKQSSIIINNKLNIDEKSINDLTVDVKALKEQFDTVSSIPAPVQPVVVEAPSGSNIDSAVLDQQFSAFNQKLISMTNKMEAYEKSLTAAKEENAMKNKKIEQLEDMIQKLTLKATNNEKTIESNKSNHNKDLNETSQQLSNKITELINMVNTKGNSDLKFEDYDNNFEIMNKKLEEMESKMNIMSDNNRAVESRVKQFENLFNQLLEQIAAAKENIDSLGARVEYELTDRLNRLDRDKAERTEVTMKADVSLLAAKSDYSEITRIDEIIQELNRRIMAQRKEMLENMTSLQKDFTNRSENIASWCLKQLRKEMKKDKNEGADIGKVRCLVCDQVVDQNRDAETVHTRERELHSNMKTQKMTKAQQEAAKLTVERPASAGAQLAKEYDRNNPEIKKKSGFKPLRDLSPSRDTSPTTLRKSPEGNKRADQLPDINNDPNIVSINGNINFVSGDREYLGITQLQFSQSANYFKDLETRFTGGNKNKMLGSRPASAGNNYRKK